MDAQLPADLPISDIDLSILFGNLLENAYDACKEVAAPAAYIQIKAGWQNEKLYFRIDGLFPKLRQSELAGMVAKIAAGGQSRAVKDQQISNENVVTFWIRIFFELFRELYVAYSRIS